MWPCETSFAMTSDDLWWNVDIHASGVVFQVGKLEDGPSVQGVFLMDILNWANLKVRERGAGKGFSLLVFGDQYNQF